MPKIELISFELCPFVQRSVITMLHKNVSFDITYIDLANKPDWFVKISPLGKVPVVKVDEKDVLFESAVINEYLDEITPPALLPKEPLAKAKLRAWIEYASAILGAQYAWLMADSSQYKKMESAYFEKLDYIEKQIQPDPFFTGNEFTLVDAALAPALMRHALIDQWHGDTVLKSWRGLAKMQAAYDEMDAVKNSVKSDFAEKLKQYLQNVDAAILA